MVVYVGMYIECVQYLYIVSVYVYMHMEVCIVYKY